jgi:hypothetical protein
MTTTKKAFLPNGNQTTGNAIVLLHYQPPICHPIQKKKQLASSFRSPPWRELHRYDVASPPSAEPTPGPTSSPIYTQSPSFYHLLLRVVCVARRNVGSSPTTCRFLLSVSRISQIQMLNPKDGELCQLLNGIHHRIFGQLNRAELLRDSHSALHGLGTIGKLGFELVPSLGEALSEARPYAVFVCGKPISTGSLDTGDDTEISRIPGVLVPLQAGPAQLRRPFLGYSRANR